MSYINQVCVINEDTNNTCSCKICHNCKGLVSKSSFLLSQTRVCNICLVNCSEDEKECVQCVNQTCSCKQSGPQDIQHSTKQGLAPPLCSHCSLAPGFCFCNSRLMNLISFDNYRDEILACANIEGEPQDDFDPRIQDRECQLHED